MLHSLIIAFMAKVKIAAMGDIHIGRVGVSHKENFKQLSEEAEILLLCGDLTERGTEEQTTMLIEELASCTVPVIAVLGNHDYDKGNEKIIETMLTQAHVKVLDGDYTIIKDIGFAGIKGCGGGFDKYMLTPFGEPMVKEFVRQSVEDSLRLENALAQLSTDKKVVLMHYSPIVQTVSGEPKEIFPFLGCSRFVSPIHRFQATIVFHGHAHHGTYEGKTEQGIPVYNVAYPILKKQFPDKPYAIFEV